MRTARPPRVLAPGMATFALAMLSACTSTPSGPPPAPPAGASTLQGWSSCSTDSCGRDFVSAYSTFTFVHLDGQRLAPRPTLTVPPGRHWVEAH